VPELPAVDAGRPTTDRPASASPLHRATGLAPDAFAERHWGRAPLLTRGADPEGFRDLLDLDAVDELLSRRGLRTPFLRLARNGSVVDSASFTGPAGVGAEIADQVRDDRVAALFADGTTVVLQALHRLWPPVIDFCSRLGAELGHPVQANAYVTPASSRGFSAHYDVHDVFVLQLAGRKHWTVHAPVHADPLRDQPWPTHAGAVAARARDDEPVIDTVLGPGDVMYLPRGWLHAATAQGEVSAHLTVGAHVAAAGSRRRRSRGARPAPRLRPRRAGHRARPRAGRRRGPARPDAGVERDAPGTGAADRRHRVRRRPRRG
jgi:ribosomal protein L16 Arg81 hydroxylase